MIVALLLACAASVADPPAEPAVEPAAPAAEPVAPTAPAEPAWPADPAAYPFRDSSLPYEPLWSRLPPPDGFARAEEEGYAAWIRALPLRPAGTPLRTWRGDTLWSGEDPRLLAVVDLPVSAADLQQCADTVIRLRAEWAWSRQDASVGFRYTSGHLSSWSGWARGERPVVSGSKVSFVRSAGADASRESYERWMDKVFTYAGTYSLSKEGRAVPAAELRPGDFLSLGGSPGHALVVLDVARDPAGEAVALIGEGYMPAQDLHLLRGPLDGWWPVSAPLDVPTWPEPFPWSVLRRWG